MSRRDVILAGAAALVVALVVVLLVRRGGADAPTPPAAATAATATAAPADAHPAAVAALPAEVPGYRVVPVGQRSYRISLVFRLRNTILNGVEGAASDYSVDAASTRSAGRTGLLIGVAAARGASPPDIPAQLLSLIAIAPGTRQRASGLEVSLIRGPEYSLGVVDAGPRRGVVAIAGRPAETLALTRAVARAIASER